MGITIHYTGKIKHQNQIKPLTDEIKDICHSLKWKYQELDMEFGVGGLLIEETEDTPQIHAKGITFTPPESETFNFLFTKKGYQVSAINIIAHTEGDFNEAEQWISTKTQFSGAEIHIAICKLLKYLAEKYFEKFEVLDEGNYWGIEDEAKTRATFQQYNHGINTFADALENYRGPAAETEEGLMQQIENILEKLRKKGEL